MNESKTNWKAHHTMFQMCGKPHLCFLYGVCGSVASAIVHLSCQSRYIVLYLTAINSNQYKVISGVLFYGECLFMEIILSTLDRKLVYAHRHIYQLYKCSLSTCAGTGMLGKVGIENLIIAGKKEHLPISFLATLCFVLFHQLQQQEKDPQAHYIGLKKTFNSIINSSDYKMVSNSSKTPPSLSKAMFTSYRIAFHAVP